MYFSGYFMVQDPALRASGFRRARLELVQGSPAAAPRPPGGPGEEEGALGRIASVSDLGPVQFADALRRS